MSAAAFVTTTTCMTTTSTACGTSATASAGVSAATGRVSGGGCMSSASVWGCCVTAAETTAARGCGSAAGTSVRSCSAAAAGESSTAAVDVTSSTGVDEAMTAPAVSVAPVGPWTYAEEDAVIEVARPVETDGGAGVGWVFVVAVTANRRRTADTDHDLRIARRHTR
jgi:hypothetical protein